jgi:hypothetical protein
MHPRSVAFPLLVNKFTNTPAPMCGWLARSDELGWHDPTIEYLTTVAQQVHTRHDAPHGMTTGGFPKCGSRTSMD